MAQNMQKARAYFTEEEVEESARYAKGLRDDLDKTDLSDEVKEKYYTIMMDYRDNKLAANVFGKQYNELVKSNKKLKKLYDNAPTDAKAREYLQQISQNEAIMLDLKSKYDYFNKKCDSIDKAHDIMRIDNDINTRLEDLGYDKGMDERPRLPSEKKTSQKR